MENINFVLEKSWKSHEIYFLDLRGNPVCEILIMDFNCPSDTHLKTGVGFCHRQVNTAFIPNM